MESDPLTIILGIGIAGTGAYFVYRSAKRGGVEAWKGFFNAETLGLPDSMRPFNFDPEKNPSPDEKELVISEDPEDPHKLALQPIAKKDDAPKGWVMIEDKKSGL